MTTPIGAYSKELQDAAAAEMKAIPGPCPRDMVIVVNCSAVKRMVIDYGDLRQRIRVAVERTDDYDRAEDAIASYALVIQTLRGSVS